MPSVAECRRMVEVRGKEGRRTRCSHAIPRSRSSTLFLPPNHNFVQRHGFSSCDELENSFFKILDDWTG